MNAKQKPLTADNRSDHLPSDSCKTISADLIQVTEDIQTLLASAKSVPGVQDNAFQEWETACDSIARQISEEILRIAVVGPIKSGKSTFVNSLLNNDYLKRGAGVVTSIVTRIRSGQRLKASLFFKSWDDVNREMSDAMRLLPPISGRTFTDAFDIRLEDDRQSLAQMLKSLSADHLIQNDARNVSIVLLSSYLAGYDRIKDILSSDQVIRTYENKDFGVHRQFTGDETLSVFLKDIELEVLDGIQSHAEIADCQGSDSPNPLHLAMIEDYLAVTHMIIYVISSRIGIRQADLRFLSLIRKMGIIDNILFAVNIDFNEHNSSEELRKQISRIKEDLTMIKPDPELYAFSALYTLFRNRKDPLPEKDRLRLAQWESETEFTAISDTGRDQFYAALNRILSQERHALLLKNHLERISVISSGVRHWIRVHKDLHARDTSAIRDMIGSVARHHAKLTHVQEMVKSTMDGAKEKIKRELKKEADRFFDPKTGKILPEISAFIAAYAASSKNTDGQSAASDFSKELYMTFQEFRQALDMFIAESVQPEVIRFIREQETAVMFQFESLADPYFSMMWDAMTEYAHQMTLLGIPTVPVKREKTDLPKIDVIKGVSRLLPPSAAASMQYSGRIRSEAVMKLGVYSLTGFLKRLFRRAPRNKQQERQMAIEDGVSRMKYETVQSILFHFRDYQENYKFQYIFKLTDAVAAHLSDLIMQGFRAYASNLSAMDDIADRNQTDKQQAVELLEKTEITSDSLIGRIDRLREKLDHTAA